VKRGADARERSEGQSNEEEERERGSETGDETQGPLAREEEIYLDISAPPNYYSLDTPLPDGPVCDLTSPPPVCSL